MLNAELKVQWSHVFCFLSSRVDSKHRALFFFRLVVLPHQDLGRLALALARARRARRWLVRRDVV